MAHLVRYRTADGNDASHEVAELADAIAHVERLRNEDGVEGARIFKVEEVEVAFEFKPYFRVEIGTATGQTTASTTTEAPADEVAGTPEPAMAPVWAPPAETTADVEADRTPAHMMTGVAEDDEPGPLADPWADAPPARDTVGNGSGRRGLFGR